MDIYSILMLEPEAKMAALIGRFVLLIYTCQPEVAKNIYVMTCRTTVRKQAKRSVSYVTGRLLTTASHIIGLVRSPTTQLLRSSGRTSVRKQGCLRAGLGYVIGTFVNKAKDAPADQRRTRPPTSVFRVMIVRPLYDGGKFREMQLSSIGCRL
jgi:hypothetical protein